MREEPLVSVLMTAFNREQYIAEAIESVRQSTYSNWELIITDDCSSDNTVNIAKSFSRIDPRIKVYQNEINLGDYPNRNRAASYAGGEFLMSVDSDDLLLPDSMQSCIELFTSFPEASFAIYSPTFTNASVLQSEDIFKRHFFNTPLLLMGPGGSVIRRNYFKTINGFPTKYGPANDGYYNLKAASRTNTIIIPFELIYYRRHEGQEINNKFSYLYNTYLFLQDALIELDLPLGDDQKLYLDKKNKRRFLVNTIKFYLRTLNWGKTEFALRKANFNFKDILSAVFQ